MIAVRNDIGVLTGTDSPVIVEVGANDGTDTEKIINAMPAARVIAFEPDPRPAERFRKRIGNRAKLFEVAIADRAKVTTLRQSGGYNPYFGDNPPNTGDPADWDLSSSILEPTDYVRNRHKWMDFNKTVQVEAAPLDWYRDEWFPHIDFLWADVQGAEALLILGAQETLRHTRYFFTECHEPSHYEGSPDLAAIKAFLPGWEFVKQIDEDNVLFVNRRYIGRI